MRSPTRAAFVIVATRVLVPYAAHAEGPVTVARVKVDASAQCASEQSFADAIRQRTDRVRISPSVAAATTTAAIEVAIRPASRGVVGDVRVIRDGRASESRTITGASCDEVTQGLSLVAALAFDPMAKASLRDETSDATAPTSTEGPPGDTSPEAPKAAPKAATSAPNETTTNLANAITSPARNRDAQPPARSAAPFAWAFRLGGSAAGMALDADTTMTFAWGGFIEIERDAPGFAPAFRASAFRADATTNSGPISTSLGWTLARATLCPYRFDVAARIGIRPCAVVDAGVVSAEAFSAAHSGGARDATGLSRSQGRSRTWAAPGLVGRAAWSPTRIVFAELEVGATVPLVRDDFAIDPNLSVYRAPSVVPFAQIGTGLRFP